MRLGQEQLAKANNIDPDQTSCEQSKLGLFCLHFVDVIWMISSFTIEIVKTGSSPVTVTLHSNLKSQISWDLIGRLNPADQSNPEKSEI